ncbi:adenylate/guanylate cyclase domain-containing protein [Actinokineospora bangkokensis]|uniref:adenylate/guanylate cyclase domain-containing protein n=1 Tax=Actinokineospora bangkokensis TaxID=1193682 RepID=UPI0011780F20|nr:adenylate/guanylate cyclase domain-containing protein [Actinokineospora bangkokensis]
MSVVAVAAVAGVVVLSVLLVRERRRYAELLASARPRREAGLQRAVKVAVSAASRLRRGGVGGMLVSSLDELARWAEEDRTELVRVSGADGTVTFAFTDIVDSTALNERLGDKGWVRLLRAHDALVREQVAARSGHVVKSQGDGFMLAFSEPEQAIGAAIGIQHALAGPKRGALRATPVAVRIGIHRGAAVSRDGDFFGRAVATAARVAAQAGGGEVLVSDDTLRGLADPGRFRLGPGRAAALKGLSGQFELHPVDWGAHQPT